jgi:hypothetical protein
VVGGFVVITRNVAAAVVEQCFAVLCAPAPNT